MLKTREPVLTRNILFEELYTKKNPNKPNIGQLGENNQPQRMVKLLNIKSQIRKTKLLIIFLI